MLTYLLQPIVTWLVGLGNGKHVHVLRIVAVLGIYLLLAGVVVMYSRATAHTIAIEKVAWQNTWNNARQRLPDQVSRLQQWYETTIPEDIRGQLKLNLQREASQFPTKYWPKIVTWFLSVTQMTGRIIALSIELILLPLLFAFYFLTDYANVREQVKFFVPERYRRVIALYAGGMDGILRQYVKGQLLLAAIAWVLVTIVLLIMRSPGALLLGLVAGLSRGIPLIGPSVGCVPVLATVLWSRGGVAFWWMLLGFVVLHLFENKYLMPRILGDSLGIHPVLIVISLLLGYEMLGLLGMFLAPPTVAMIRFVVTTRRNAQKQKMAVGLASSGEQLAVSSEQ
jgi:predicted PurR-regulated permease PerM